MSRDDLKAALAKAREILADVEETVEFTCANTNAHLADSLMEQSFEELDECRAEVARLESLLEDLE